MRATTPHPPHIPSASQDWGARTLLADRGIAAWTSARLDALAASVPLGRHVPYEGRIPRITPLVALVRRTIGPVARAYLSPDAEFDGYRAFRHVARHPCVTCYCTVHPRLEVQREALSLRRQCRLISHVTYRYIALHSVT